MRNLDFNQPGFSQIRPRQKFAPQPEKTSFSAIMNQLPLEIVDNICSYLDHDSLKSVLLLSRYFQFAAEKYSGAFRKCATNANDIDTFITKYSGRHLRHLRELEFRVDLSPPEETDGPDGDAGLPIFRESREELISIDE